MSTRLFFNFQKRLSRRTVLRGAGASMALPWLTAMEPAFAKLAVEKTPRRFVGITLGLGLVSENLYPKEAGTDWSTSRYMQHLKDLQPDLTLISGSSHPGVSGGHRASASILTANPLAPAGRASNSISLDQYMSKYLGNLTRFPSLTLSVQGNESSSYTESGAMIPALDSPSAVYSQLFIENTQKERELAAQRLQQGRSIMDVVAEDAKSLMKELAPSDKDRLDNYFTSVRDLEVRLAESQRWSDQPKPVVSEPRPVDIGNTADVIGRERLMFDVIRLALATDSSRFITLNLQGGGSVVPVQGVDQGYHGLSHHGMDDEKLAQLALVEEALLKTWGQFLRELKEIKEEQATLLDHSMIYMTSNLGNSSNHDTKNMPVLFAGGGFRHGQHLAFDRANNEPLCNLYVSMLQRLGLEEDRFASSTGTLRGLEMTRSSL